jgi:hypothetical protein
MKKKLIIVAFLFIFLCFITFLIYRTLIFVQKTPVSNIENKTTTSNVSAVENLSNALKHKVVTNKDITELTNGLFIFGDCNGEFDCSHCHNLTTLKGSPRSVDTFNCSFCPKLTSLKDGPEKVYNTYYCNNCGLTSLEGSPKINYGFNCCCNPIKNLKGASKKVNAKFICSYCPELETLEGCPEHVKGWFDCSNCPKLEFESLKKYFPKKIEDDFMCISNFKDKTQEERNELRSYLYLKLGHDIEMILM